MMVTVKYVLVILHTDNDGEGGTFSTYSLLSRYVSAPSKLFLVKADGLVDEYHPP